MGFGLADLSGYIFYFRTKEIMLGEWSRKVSLLSASSAARVWGVVSNFSLLRRRKSLSISSL